MIDTQECRQIRRVAVDFDRSLSFRDHNRLPRNILILGLLAICSQFYAVIVAAESNERPPNKLYAEYCSVCHGDRGDGNSHARQGLVPPPRNFADPALTEQLSHERMFAAIHDGRPGTAMVAWSTKLSDAEIGSLVNYISENFVATTTTDNNPGSILYRQNCSVCHGDDGTGAIWGQSSLAKPPRNFRSEQARRELSPERMIAVITNGLAGTPMPGFGTQLRQEQIESIVDYVATEFIQESLTDLALPNGLLGNPDTGKAYYLANCVPCHGVSGAGDGPRAYFIFPKPRNFLDPASRARFDRPTLFYGIKNGVVGREMPAWGKVMTDQEIADIAEYVLLGIID